MAKAGRKRKRGRRQPNGQLARSTPAIRENVLQTVVEARMRIYGLTAAQARSELAGYEIGRMALRGDFGQDYQPYIDAVYDYVMATSDYMRIKCPQQPMPRAIDYLAGRGATLRAEPSLKTVDRIVERYERKLALLEPVDSHARMVFHQIAFFDRSCETEHKHLVISCADALMGR